MKKEEALVWYFKHEDWGDEWQERKSMARHFYEFAEEMAKKYLRDDPCDPHHFEFEITMKNWMGVEQTFAVDAETVVSFSSVRLK